MVATMMNMIFYRNNFRLSLWCTLILLIIAFTVLACIFYSRITKPMPAYFATTADGYLIEVQPK